MEKKLSYRKTNVAENYTPEIIRDVEYPSVFTSIEKTEKGLFLIHAYYESENERFVRKKRKIF